MNKQLTCAKYADFIHTMSRKRQPFSPWKLARRRGIGNIVPITMRDMGLIKPAENGGHIWTGPVVVKGSPALLSLAEHVRAGQWAVLKTFPSQQRAYKKARRNGHAEPKAKRTNGRPLTAKKVATPIHSNGHRTRIWSILWGALKITTHA